MMPKRYIALLSSLFLLLELADATLPSLENRTALMPEVLGAQTILTFPGGTDYDAHEYLRYSIQHELKRRLSPSAQVLLQEDNDFVHSNARYSNYKRPTYIAAVRVAEEKDVIETVNYARSRGIPFVARSGGHSLTTSLRRIKNGIIIDMRGLDITEFDSDKQQMTVGGGVQTGQFANASFAVGMEVTVGSCPCTGVMGVALGAGIGRLQGKYGYLTDNMLDVRLLLANGTVITASETQNSDIFWALRGAGHNFGIALEATFQLYPQENDGKHYVVDFEFELDHVEEVFELMNKVSSPMPRELAIFVIGRKRGATGVPTLNVNLVWAGPPGDAAPTIDLFAALNPIWRDEKVSAWDALPWATYNGLNNILCTPEGWARFPIKNFYAANVKSYDVPTMRKFFDDWRDANTKFDGQAMFSVMFESFAQQGVRTSSSDLSSVPWREESDHFLLVEAAYKPELESHAEEFDNWLSKQQKSWISTSGYGRLHQYVNYGHGEKEPIEALYGYEPWRLEKLRELKKELDPEGWFNGYQPFVQEFELDNK